MNRTQAILVGGSLALHVGLGVWMGLLPKEKKTDSVAIALSESKKKKDEARPPAPPPPLPPSPAVAKAKVAAVAPKAAAAEPPPEAAPPPRAAAAGDAPAAMDGFADLGLAMGGNGMALPSGPGRAAAPAKAAAAAPVAAKAKSLVAAADECTEAPVKPQLDHQSQPAYTSEGRQASVEGVVKLEVSIDETGRVTNVRVLKGLGFGLDESAVAAARQWTFKPATKCGKPVLFVVKPGVRFQLGS